MDDLKIPLLSSTDSAIKNVTDKPTKIIGQMISDLLAIAASRVRIFSEAKVVPNTVSAEIFSQNIFDGVSSIEEEKITVPELQIIGQAINDSTYCLEHEELRSMFASLIVNSCNTDYLKLIHPSFSNSLKCMSPYDAVLFKRLAKNKTQHTDAVEYMAIGKDSYCLYPCIIFTDEYFKDFEMQSISISALKHLGLIEYTNSGPFRVDKRFEENEYFRNLELKYSEGTLHPVARPMEVTLTPYGGAFATACSLPESS